MAKPNYGIDAPNVIRNLFLAASAFLLLGLAIPHLRNGRISEFLWPAGWMCVPALLMLNYGMRGKFRHRERVLAKVNWRGDEQVLDVGTGCGLLLIGAAKRLTTGHATGIDIWNAEDLSAL